jgi:hypothetical protein
MTRSIKKKNGTKTRKRILKSRKNILRGGQKGPRPVTTAAPPPVPKAAPPPVPKAAPPPVPKAAPPPVPAGVTEAASKSGVRSVFGVPITVPTIATLREKLATAATSAGQTVSNVGKKAGVELLKQTVFAGEIKAQKRKEKQNAAKERIKAMIGPNSGPKISVAEFYGSNER